MTARKRFWRRWWFRWLVLPPALLVVVISSSAAILITRDCRDFVLVLDSHAHPYANLVVSLVQGGSPEQVSILWEGRLKKPGKAYIPIRYSDGLYHYDLIGLRVEVQDPDRTESRVRDIVSKRIYGASHHIIIGQNDILYELSNFGYFASFQAVPPSGWGTLLSLANEFANYLSCANSTRENAAS